MSKRTLILCRSLGVLVLLAVLIGGDRWGAHLLDRFVMSSHFRYSQLYKGELPAQVVILGNSRGLHMLHPPSITELTGLKAANVSFNALPTELMPVIWADYLDHHDPPELLLFEISCVNRQDETGAMERFKTYMDESPRICQALAELRPREYAASQVSHLYRYNNEFLMRNLFFRNRSDQSWIMQEQASDELIEQMVDLGAEPLVYSDSFVAAAQKVLDDAQQHNVRVELFIGPYHPDYFDICYGMSEWKDWLEEKLGRRIYDYSDALVTPDAFADHMHLNLKGTGELIVMMQRDGLL